MVTGPCGVTTVTRNGWFWADGAGRGSATATAAGTSDTAIVDATVGVGSCLGALTSDGGRPRLLNDGPGNGGGGG